MGATKTETVQDLKWATGTNRWSLKVCGILREKDYSRCRNILSNLIVPLYALIIFTFGLYPQSLALFKVWGDVGLMVENLIISMPCIVTLCKIITMWFKKEVISTMMNFITEDWSKLRSKEELKVMIKYAQLSRLISFGAYFAIGSSILVYQPPVIFGVVLRTVTNLTDTGHRPLALQAAYPIDVYQTPIYQLTAISQVLSCSLAGFCYSTVGGLFSLIVLHVCSQLENLKINIECMVKDCRRNRKNFQRALTSNVREHQRLIRFVSMIESTFSIMLLMIIPAFMITFCVQGYMLINVLNDDVNVPMIQLVFCILYIIFVLFVMFAYSSVGQVLVTQSEEIQYAAYNCEWYNLKPNEAAQLVLILIRSQRPLTITAGKFVPLTISTFASLLKTTSGYLSCLLAVQN